MDKAGQPAKTYIQQHCNPEAMDDRKGGERGLGISVLKAWHDDDEDDDELYRNNSTIRVQIDYS